MRWVVTVAVAYLAVRGIVHAVDAQNFPEASRAWALGLYTGAGFVVAAVLHLQPRPPRR